MKINIQCIGIEIFIFCLAVIVVIVFVFPEMTYATYADDTAVSESADGYFNVCDYTEHDNGTSKSIPDNVLSFKGGNLKNVACYVTKNYRTDKDGTVVDRYCFKTSLTLPVTIKRELWKGFLDQGKKERETRVQSQNTNSLPVDASEAVVHCYVFSSESKVDAYLRGEIDASEADNFGDVTPEDIDKNIPYYDKFSVAFDSSANSLKYELWEFNGDITGKTSVSMSENQQVKLQECKNVYYRYVDYAIYIFQAKNVVRTPDQESNGIKTDSQKRLVVGSISSSSTWGLKAAEEFAVIGESGSDACKLRLVEAKTVDNSSFLNASEALDITFSDKHAIDRNILLGSRYQLIGHVIAVQCYTYEDGQYKYGQTTFGYGWRKGYGKNIGDGGYVIDPDSPDPPAPVDPTDPTPTDPVNPESWDLITYVKNLYSQLSSYFTLTKRELSAVPAVIWGLIATALAVNLAIIVFKAIRGM